LGVLSLSTPHDQRKRSRWRRSAPPIYDIPQDGCGIVAESTKTADCLVGQGADDGAGQRVDARCAGRDSSAGADQLRGLALAEFVVPEVRMVGGHEDEGRFGVDYPPFGRH
jgi:hypothetical protein